MYVCMYVCMYVSFIHSLYVTMCLNTNQSEELLVGGAYECDRLRASIEASVDVKPTAILGK